MKANYYVYKAYKLLIKELAEEKEMSIRDVVKEMVDTLPEPLAHVSDREIRKYRQRLNQMPNTDHYHKNDEGVEAVGIELTDTQYQKLIFWAMEDDIYPSDELCELLVEQYPERLARIYRENKLRGPIPRIIQENWVPYQDPKKRFSFDLDSERAAILYEFISKHKGMSLSDALEYFVNEYMSEEPKPIVKERCRGENMEQYNVRLIPEVYERFQEIAKRNGVTKVSVVQYFVDNYCDYDEALLLAA